MKDTALRLIRGVVPPVAFAAFRILTERSGFSGNYRSWEDACRASEGYDSGIILERVKDALLKVKNGEAAYERDSVLFDTVQHSWPLLAGLLWVASKSGNSLNLLDFGGSLGSTYYQNLNFLAHLTPFKWSIVEQHAFVECGRSHFENDHLRFYHDVDECMAQRAPDVLLLSSVIQYLESPYQMLGDLLRRGFTYLLFDRTPFLSQGEDRITVQRVPPEIYPASYPAWFFNQEKFLDFFSRDYDLMAEFDSFESFRVGTTHAQNKGFIFRKR